MLAFFQACWIILCQLAPWLLLGMILSGMLHVLLPRDFVRRKFHGIGGIVKAVLLGVPLPLCSCGVIPAGIGLKNQGASDGASVGFLISTPQTGIDSVLVSASFFGWPFAVFKVFAAAITGFIGGWLTDVTRPLDHEELTGDVKVHDHLTHSEVPGQSKWVAAWQHAVEILRSIWIWLLIGVFVSAAIEVLGLNQYLIQITDYGLFPAMVLVLLISAPLYVCATASVPIAAALVQSGLPPAVALVFLMAGPATNLTTMGAIRTRFGFRVLLVYLSTLVVGSFLFAAIFDWVLTSSVTNADSHVHDHTQWWSILSALFTLGLIATFVWSYLTKSIARRMVDRSLQSFDVKVDGMHCGNCVSRLETELSKAAGVEAVEVNLESGTAKIFGLADRNTIVDVIEKLGFHVPSGIHSH
jgi:uncharacterized membrane protein YraQ (UPF0718 family)/copper chaperone CopZ